MIKKMTNHKWEAARQMFLNGKTEKEICSYFDIKRRVLQKRKKKMSWALTRREEVSTTGTEPRLSEDDKRSRYMSIMGDMIDRDLETLSSKTTKTPARMKEKWEIVKDVHSVAKDIHDIGKEVEVDKGNFMLSFRNLYMNLVSSKEEKLASSQPCIELDDETKCDGIPS